MKVVPLLIFWSLPLLQAVERGPSLADVDARHAGAHVNSPLFQRSEDVPCPGEPSGGSLGGSLWDEEDSLEDVFFDAGLGLFGSSLIHGHRDLSSLAHGQNDLLRTPSHPHPLRC